MEQRWKVLILLFFTRIALGFQFQVPGSVTPRLVEELQIDYRLAGILIGLFLLAGIFLSVPAGITHKYSSDKTLVTLGLVLLAVGGLISGFGESYGIVAAGRVISGAGFVFGTLYYTKIVTDWFSGKELATAMGILVLSWPIGIALGQNLHPVLADWLGYSAAFFFSAMYCVAAAVSLWVLYKQPDATGENSNKKTPNAKLSVYHLKLTLIAALIWAFFNAGYVVFLSFSVDALINTGYTHGYASALTSIPNWLMVISAVVAGKIADQTGSHSMILYVSMASAVASMILLAQGIAVIPALLIFGLLALSPAGIIMALTGEAMPAESRAFGMGIFFTLYFVVGLPAPGIAGWLYDISSDPGAPLLFGAFLFGLVGVCNFWFRFSLSDNAKTYF